MCALAARRRARRERRHCAHRPAAGQGEVRRSRRASARPARCRPTACAWTRKTPRRPVAVGDVIYVEPIDGKPGPVSAAADPGYLRRHRGDGPVHGPRLRHGRRLLLRPVGVQPRHAGAAPAGLVLQALRLRHRARQRLHALLRRSSTSRSTIDQANGEIWTPENFEAATAPARITLRYGVEHSKNLMTVRLARDVGMPLIAEYAQALRHL